MRLIEKLSEKGGEDDIVAWIGRLLYENRDVFYFEDKPGVTYIKMDTIKSLYDLLNVKVMNEVSVQEFFDLLQQCGEENKQMELQYQELDEYVPLGVCQEFVRQFLGGFVGLAKELEYDSI